MDNESDVKLYRDRGGNWIAKFVGGEHQALRGRGPSRIEALGDLEERAAGHNPTEQTLADRRKEA